MSATADPAELPVVIAASGQRCGSTLLQRLISSHPEILVWGEHGGALGPVLEAVPRLIGWSEGPGADARSEAGRRGLDSFIANLTPEPAVVREAFRKLFLELFHAPGSQLGRRRWGFKEVRYGWHECRGFYELFPEAAFIHVTRDPRAVVLSLDWWERTQPDWRRAWSLAAMRSWTTINASFLNHAGEPPKVLTLRLEQVVSDPAGAVELIAERIGVDASGFDRQVFDRKVHGPGADGGHERKLTPLDEIDDDLRATLDSAELRSVAASLGYQL